MTGPRPLTVLATMRNEGAHILDWVAHQKALGFDRIVICTNDCDDPTAELAGRLDMLGLVRHHLTRVPRGLPLQYAAYGQASAYPEVRGAAWVLICDADEYLCVNTGDGSVRALVAAAGREAEGIILPWRIFGPAGQWDHRDRPVTETCPYTHAGRKGLHVWTKTMVRPDAPIAGTYVHIPRPRDGLGRDLRLELPGGVAPRRTGYKEFLVQADWSVAQLNHYALRSVEDFLVKRDRGHAMPTQRRTNLGYWSNYDHGSTRCDRIRRYDAAARAWRARLHADPTLALYHAEAVAWLRARAAEIAALPEWAADLAEIRRRLDAWNAPAEAGA
ncbi:MAG TPA: glycosyltransferase family 2 protein [Paracoccaceae bacterium]|nr:glycosyltransferase family 2 protein [Paracoccaceae bacterium]HMO71548.1 glycosyltransferase family 2 protein [Paracoccaceae bacterium]